LEVAFWAAVAESGAEPLDVISADAKLKHPRFSATTLAQE
jgi:hypothetical protein